MDNTMPKRELSHLDRYINSVSICNTLALLISQNTMTEFLQRIAFLIKLKNCWMKGHMDVQYICSYCDSVSQDNVVLAESMSSIASQILMNSTKDLDTGSDSNSTVDFQLDIPSPGCSSESASEHASEYHNDRIYPPTQSAPAPPTGSLQQAVGDTEHVACDTERVLPETEPLYTVCTICNRRLSSGTALTKHMRCHHGIKYQPVNAESAVSGSAPNSSSAGKTESSVSSGFICSVCGRQFRLRQLLATHSVTHTGERPYPCRFPDCGKRFGQSSTRNYHERTHGDARPYVCSQCGLRFKLQPILRVHVATMHGCVPAHQCPICGKLFKLAGAMRTHMKGTHSDVRPFNCDTCLKAFKSRQQLRRHRRDMHSEVKPLSCPVCGKTFTQACNMRTHMRTHTGEKPYVCTICECRFAHSGTLKGHMATHRNVQKSASDDSCLDFRLSS